jgi:hypothetical protein
MGLIFTASESFGFKESNTELFLSRFDKAFQPQLSLTEKLPQPRRLASKRN